MTLWRWSYVSHVTHFNDSYDDSSKDESKLTEFLFVNKFLFCSLNNSHLHFKNDFECPKNWISWNFRAEYRIWWHVDDRLIGVTIEHFKVFSEKPIRFGNFDEKSDFRKFFGHPKWWMSVNWICNWFSFVENLKFRLEIHFVYSWRKFQKFEKNSNFRSGRKFKFCFRINLFEKVGRAISDSIKLTRLGLNIENRTSIPKIGKIFELDHREFYVNLVSKNSNNHRFSFPRLLLAASSLQNWDFWGDVIRWLMMDLKLQYDRVKSTYGHVRSKRLTADGRQVVVKEQMRKFWSSKFDQTARPFIIN